MATEIPMQLNFQQLLSHTFPGFFSAITFFMLIDVWSSLHLESSILRDITSLIAFVGLMFVMGTIFGVITDGIHHSIIEEKIFNKSEKIGKINKKIRKIAKDYHKKNLSRDLLCNGKTIDCEDCHHYHDDCELDEFIIDHYYIYGRNQDQIISIDTFLNEGFYCYSEFYANAFLSLVPFSIVLPFYLSKSSDMSWNLALILGCIFLIFSGICFYSSYWLYLYYHELLLSFVLGYVCTQDATQRVDKMS
jgi:hypothetical protein